METLTELFASDMHPQMIFNVMLGYWMWRTERRVLKIEQWLKFHYENTIKEG